ncbi:hypothetical protein L1049_002114 [Liquidambar formosana]|uniref:DUF4378 domain-containing protein n=1 Tax=Liquidambar formosana TaxID=63359 RepID=A0AAP0NGG8_LIQFO
MNDTAGKTSSSLAITEKRPHRPGGCVGIFFQLFDWNRRLAKKKLFSRKLLPPARAKQASKKFGGNEKLPTAKLHLIADENRGGFPNVKKNGVHGVNTERKHEMRAPSLVARLMGLESMPAVQRDKPKKALGAEVYANVDEKFEGSHGGSDKEDVSLEKGQMKHELRPQKLQKTGPFEGRAVTRFGAEALQIKSILSRSRKHHHPKLASPVKSPRVLSGRSASRLIDAANKILEPGLQATNRAKCALTYSNSVHRSPKDEVMVEGMTVVSPGLPRQTGYCTNAAKAVMGQSSCKDSGNLVDVVDVRPDVEEHPLVFASSVSNCVNSSSQGSGMSKPRPLISSLELQQDRIHQNSRDQPISLVSLEKDNVSARSEPSRDGKPLPRDGHERWHFSSQPRKPQKDEIPARSKLSTTQSRRVSSAENSVGGARDFVALNRSLSGRSRMKAPTKMDNSKLDAERKFCNRRDDSLTQMRTPMRKRRTINVNGQIECTNSAASTSGKQRNVRCDGMTGKGKGLNNRSMNQTCIESKSANHGEGNISSGTKNSDVVSFTFNSPMKQKTVILSPKEMEEKRWERDEFVGNSISQQRKLTLDENYGKSFQKPLPLRGDALGALLEQKLKELTCQEEDELATGGTPPRRTTAMILQELISALTAEQPISQDDGAVGINQNVQDPRGHVFSQNYMFSTDIPLLAKAKTEGTSVRFSREVDHFSPGSVLEASFSNDSCISSSLDDSSVLKLHYDSMDYCYDQLQTSEPDADLLDSATSLDKGRTCSAMMTDLVNHISKILHSINLAGTELSGSKLTHAKEVILNAQLLFGNAALHSDGMKDIFIAPFLDELDTIANAMSKSNCCFNFEEMKETNQCRQFLFDCLIECLDSKYGRYCKSGFKAWTRLPLCMSTEMLIQGVDEEVRRWTDLAGKIPDEIIEWEMSHSLGKWTDFEIEAFEDGAEVGGDILQILVEEIVRDLCEF